MRRKALRTIALGSLVLVVVLSAARGARSTGRQSTVSTHAPLEQSLMDGNAEIALARSAASGSISQDAEVTVLGRHGYESAVQGKNGFVCVVQRSWTAGIDDPDF
jgi:hypothetical protein